jgi:predicted nucleic acid-binding protein
VIVVSDSSPLIALARVGQLHLLQILFGEVLVPGAVWDEVVQVDRPEVAEILSADWVRVVAVADDSYLLALRTELDRGEAEAISLAADVRADTLLLDEGSARQLAVSMGLQVIGVVGVLKLAKQRGFITEVRPVLDQLVTVLSFRLGKSLCDQTLRDAGEL